MCCRRRVGNVSRFLRHGNARADVGLIVATSTFRKSWTAHRGVHPLKPHAEPRPQRTGVSCRVRGRAGVLHPGSPGADYNVMITTITPIQERTPPRRPQIPAAQPRHAMINRRCRSSRKRECPFTNAAPRGGSIISTANHDVAHLPRRSGGRRARRREQELRRAPRTTASKTQLQESRHFRNSLEQAVKTAGPPFRALADEITTRCGSASVDPRRDDLALYAPELEKITVATASPSCAELEPAQSARARHRQRQCPAIRRINPRRITSSSSNHARTGQCPPE